MEKIMTTTAEMPRKKAHVVSKMFTKTQFFIVFWTLVLGPFEYLYLGLPLLSVVLIRVVAIGSNLLWYKYWFERSFWQKGLEYADAPNKTTAQKLKLFGVRMLRMITMKFNVNITNFTLLAGLAWLLSGVYDTGIHFTLFGLMKKVMIVTMFAVVLTGPYEIFLKFFGFETGHGEEVDIASDI